jgi:LL-H family phage holin
MDPVLAQSLSELSIAYGVPFALALAGILFKFAVHHLPKNRQDEVMGVVTQVVNGVEQMYQASPGTGPAKKQEAIKLVKAMLGDLGLKASDATVSVLIESAVRGMNLALAGQAPAAEAAQSLPVGA